MFLETKEVLRASKESIQVSMKFFLQFGSCMYIIAATRAEGGLVSYWTTTDKLEFTDRSEVQRRFGSEEIAIFQQRMIIAPPLGTTRVKKDWAIKSNFTPSISNIKLEFLLCIPLQKTFIKLTSIDINWLLDPCY